MRIFDVLYEIPQRRKSDPAAIKFTDIYQKHCHRWTEIGGIKMVEYDFDDGVMQLSNKQPFVIPLFVIKTLTTRLLLIKIRNNFYR